MIAEQDCANREYQLQSERPKAALNAFKAIIRTKYALTQNQKSERTAAYTELRELRKLWQRRLDRAAKRYERHKHTTDPPSGTQLDKYLEDIDVHWDADDYIRLQYPDSRYHLTHEGTDPNTTSDHDTTSSSQQIRHPEHRAGPSNLDDAAFDEVVYNTLKDFLGRH